MVRYDASFTSPSEDNFLGMHVCYTKLCWLGVGDKYNTRSMLNLLLLLIFRLYLTIYVIEKYIIIRNFFFIYFITKNESQLINLYI
jgi:hypothetical protein